MGGFAADLAGAARSLVRRPFFTVVAGATLAVGIGANAAIFGVVDSVLLNPLPYPDSDRIVALHYAAPGLDLPIVPFSEGMYLHHRGSVSTLDGLAIYDRQDVNLVSDVGPERLGAARVTEGFFEIFRQEAVLGRSFAPGEDRAGAEPIVVLGHGLWARAFGSDPAVVGTLVELDGVRRRVIGVMPEDFAYPMEAELWIPFEIDDADPDTDSFSFLGVGRLANGADVASLNRELDRLLQRFGENPDEDGLRALLAQAQMRADGKPLKALFVADIERTLWIVLGTVGFVLLIACANVANLFLVRAESRRRETALRTALGAGRADLVRRDLAESLVLGLVSGAVGLGIAALGMRALVGLAPQGLPRVDEIGIDGSVVLYTAAISLLACLLFGLLPTLGSPRGDLSGSLKDGSRTATLGRARQRTRSVLVVAQVALALVLLVASGLMVRSFDAMRSVDPGFDADDRLVFRVTLPAALYPDAAAARPFYRTLEDRLVAIPGVSAVALASTVPLMDTKNASNLQPSDRPRPEGELGPLVDLRWVGPGYFAALEIELLDGRELTDEDGADGVRAVVVSEKLARTFWPDDTSVLGRRIRGQAEDAPEWEVVGVVRDVRYESLVKEPGILAYFPLITGDRAPAPIRSLTAVLRTGAEPTAFVAGAREALHEADPRLPLVDPRPMSSILADARATTSFTMVLLAIAAGIALLLGTVGIYGVVSYATGQRTQEIGVRMALGAPSGRVLRGVVAGGLALAAAGVTLGLAASFGASRLLASMLYGVSPHDPLTYVATAAALVLVAAAASWIPARRAARIDPVHALRAD